MTDKIQNKLRKAAVGMGTRKLEDYFFQITCAEAIEAAHRIEELEAALSSIREKAWNEPCSYNLADKALKATEAETPNCPVCNDDPLKCADHLGFCLSEPIKEEAETPEHQKTDDHIVRLSDETASDYVLQDDYQEHRRSTEETLNSLLLHTRNLDQTLDSVVDQLRSLERRMSAASPNVSYRYSNWCEEESDPTPASHESEDKTLEPQLGEVSTNGHVFRPWSGFHSTPDEARWQEERRSGKAKRASSSG